MTKSLSNFKGLTKYQRLKQHLQTRWGVILSRGSVEKGHGFSTGYVINAPWGMTRYRTLKEIESAIEKESGNSVE